MRRLIKNGALLVTCNQVIAEGAVLLRNIVLARALGPEQMGLAIALAIALRCLEMVSYLAADRLLVQARDGNAPLFQANAHGLEVARGLLSGVVLAALAYPAAIAIGHPETAWAFAALGLAPALRGFTHLDYRRLQRRLRFGPTLKVESIANVAGTAAVWPALQWSGDFSALLWVSLVHASAHVLMSHAVARRAYRLRFDRLYLGRMLRFGWPILLNSLLMFGVFQGDRLIVALSVSPAELGRYALALQLGLLPTLVVARASLALLLPLLARVQDAPVAFEQRYRRSLALLVIAAIAFVVGYAAGGNLLVTTLFGDAFLVAPAVMSWLGCALAVRIVRIAPGTATLALGDSRTLMHANLWRIGGLVLAAWAGIAGLGLSVIAAAAAAGELAALAAGVWLLWRRHGIATPLPTVLSALLIVGVAAAWPWLAPLAAAQTAGALAVALIVAGLLARAHPRSAQGTRLGAPQ